MTRAGGRSPANITRHLQGAEFPASRQELIARARQCGAEAEVLRALEGIPDESYEDIADVVAALGSGDDEPEEEDEERDGDDEAGAA